MSICEIRHIQRCLPDDPGAVGVGRVHFRAAPSDGVNGEGGWVSAEVSRVLSDDGSLRIRFPNSEGSDGVPHRRRFAILTQDAYRIGDEWIEVRREAGKLMTVCSPASWEINGNEIVLTCTDVLALTSLTRDEVLNAWCAPPRDVLDYYGRLELPWILRDFTNWSTTGTGTASDGWHYTAAQPDRAGIRLVGAGAVYYEPAMDAFGGGIDWTTQITGRLVTGSVGLFAFSMYVEISDQGTVSTYNHMSWETKKRADVGPGKPFTIRIYRRGEWVYCQVNGETVDIRRSPVSYTVLFAQNSGESIISQFTSSTVERFLTSESEPGDLHLPGAPAYGGLAGQYFLEEDAKARWGASNDYASFAASYLNPMQGEYANRIDPTLAFASANPPAWQPAGPANGTWWSARWTGAILLDLAAADRELQLIAGNGDAVKVWVGRRGPGEAPLISRGTGTGATPYTSGSLRSHLGQSAKGWYPIIIEYLHGFDTGGLQLKDGPVGGAYATVPRERLSPYGVFQDKVQHESHRSMIDRVTQEFGYQWTIQPRSLESGAFPGRLIPRVRQGTDRNVRLTDADERTSGLRASGNAADAAVRLLIDAAGLAAPGGEGSTTAEAWDIPGALDSLYVATAWEGAPEITDPGLASQRAESLLALHAGPTQTVSANPSGERTLTDTWPLTGVLSRIEWEPGDAPLLDFPNIAVVDRTPRQLTAVTWPCRPGGVGAPEATWLNKPKGKRTIARRALQGASAAQRNYQGQMGELAGSVASNVPGWAGSALSWLAASGAIVSLRLNVLVLTGGPATLVINGTAVAGTVSAPGSIDVSAYKATSSVQQATLTIPAGGQWVASLSAKVIV